MKKINSIVVPVDFSKSSIEAVRYAAFLAKKHNSKIHLINIIPGINYFFAYPDAGVTSAQVLSSHQNMVSELKENNKTRLSYIESTDYLKSVQVKSAVVAGSNIHSDIISFAEEKKADLIVMGTKGSSSLKRSFIGSKTERVMRLTSIPVIVIRGNHGQNKLRKIVFASRFEKDCYEVYPVLNNLVKEFNPVIHLLRVNTKNEFKSFDELKDGIIKFTKRFSGDFVPHVRASYEIDEGIAKFAKTVKADLIAIGLKRKKGASRILGSRIAEGVCRLTNIPVIAIDIP